MNAQHRRLLGVFPHPDDEAYAAGGLLALCARAGAQVSLVCATRGEHGAILSPVEGPLADVRAAELAASCVALGARPPLFLDLPDGEVAAHQETGAARLREIIAAVEPDVIVTLGADGGYGHSDHLACTRIVAQASGGRRVLHAQFPRDLFAPVRRAMRQVGTPIDPATPRQLGVTARDVDLRVSIAAVRDAKLAALASHVSQLAGGDPHAFLQPGFIDALLDEEWYTVAAGPPLPGGAGDPFAGL